MSKIKGYSIQNGEPTPDNPAEIKSLDIEKDIKFIDEMIKEYNTFGDLDNTDYEDTDKIYKAIENILAERKQDKARIKELEAKQKEMCEEYCPKTERIKELEQENRIQRRQLNSAFDRGWIPKEKVKDLIENETINISGFECIAVEDLEELLEESK